MPLADVARSKIYSYDVSGWPQWLQVLVGTLVIALLVWIGIKLFKLTLWLLLIVLLVGGLGWAGWLFLGSR